MSYCSNIAKTKNLKTLSNPEKTASDDIPNWADWNFTGTWGLRILFSDVIDIEIGNISGYYGKFFGPIGIFKGKFYPHWNHTKITNIVGIQFGIVIFGEMGEINLTEIYDDVKTNETNFVGIGDKNETHVDWRIMGREGPTFYITGTFSKLE